MIKQRNIISAYVYTFVSWFGITNLWVIYLGQQGLSLVQIGLCESIFHVASFLFEVPSGVLADRFSYKTVLFASRITTIASAVLMLVGQSWWWFAVSFVVSAWSYNLQSGTLEALVYESLAPATREAQYARATSMMGSLSEIAATAGVIVAGIFVHWHFSWVYRIQILLALVGLLCVASLRTPAGRSATGKDAAPRQTVVTIVRAAGHVLRTQPALRNLMVLDASLSAVATAYYYYFQNVMTTHHWSSPMISGLMLTGSLLAVVGMQLLPWIQRRIGRFALLLGMTLLMVVALLRGGPHCPRDGRPLPGGPNGGRGHLPVVQHVLQRHDSGWTAGNFAIRGQYAVFRCDGGALPGCRLGYQPLGFQRYLCRARRRDERHRGRLGRGAKTWWQVM
ncbi:MFS transporter [Lacticaseibacillus pantheris]|uniref:MFS transporter n=1 Tax=Lacticaseibacillus pantheris TaxID=171523 RepID=UPI0006D253FA|nr:MFS transporter [Lacticaseibacillus pantheris]